MPANIHTASATIHNAMLSRWRSFTVFLLLCNRERSLGI